MKSEQNSNIINAEVVVEVQKESLDEGNLSFKSQESVDSDDSLKDEDEKEEILEEPPKYEDHDDTKDELEDSLNTMDENHNNNSKTIEDSMLNDSEVPEDKNQNVVEEFVEMPKSQIILPPMEVRFQNTGACVENEQKHIHSTLKLTKYRLGKKCSNSP